MLFNSIEFILFFIIVVPIYFLLPQRYRWVLLLLSSYIFYMFWKPVYILLIMFSTIIDYFAAILMAKQKTKGRRRLFLIASIITNLGLLFTFKYFNFFSYMFSKTVSILGLNFVPFNLNLLLPVGISFYTFQTLSYTIDVYRGKKDPEKHLGIFALYVSFFPQLVAGPIERSTHLLPQFYQKQPFDWERIRQGFLLMLFGYFKKVVIADRLAIFVDKAYGSPTEWNGWVLITATIFFAIQIYCDFSGYTDIAIGAAKILGFDLMQNFKRPYFSKSIKEFWRRWHISLSSWFKEYVYVPLGGSRKSYIRTNLNLLITFTISGLWHGASFHFIFWGMLNGFYLILENIFSALYSKLFKNNLTKSLSITLKCIRILYTFLLINIAWVFFRANSMTDAIWILNSFSSLSIKDLFMNGFVLNPVFYTLGLDRQEFILALFSVLTLFIIDLLDRNQKLNKNIINEPFLGRWGVITLLLLTILIFGVYGNYDQSQFIYFTF